jgi:hypothetical protein
MKFMKQKAILFLLLVALTNSIIAQVFIETGSPVNPRDAFGSINVYGSGDLAKGIPYDRIKGSPFWKDEWRTGILYNYQDSVLAKCPVKINLASQQVHFLNLKGQEMVPAGGIVRKVVIHDETDSNRIVTVFHNNISEIREQTKNKDHYVQEMNQGDVQLLRLTVRKVETGDSLFGTMKRYYFSDVHEYYLRVNNRIEKIKKLNKEEFFALLPAASKFNEWIRKEKLKFRDEADYIRFLDHYNSRVLGKK